MSQLATNTLSTPVHDVPPRKATPNPAKTALTLAPPARQPQRTTYDRAKFASPPLERFMYAAEATAPAPTLVAPEKFAASVVGQAVEILMGHRPVRQLQTWLHPEVYDALARRAGLGRRIHGKPEKCRSPRIKRVRVCQPRPGVAEASLVIFDGKKIRAAAVRLEVRRGRWHVTALEII